MLSFTWFSSPNCHQSLRPNFNSYRNCGNRSIISPFFTTGTLKTIYGLFLNFITTIGTKLKHEVSITKNTSGWILKMLEFPNLHLLLYLFPVLLLLFQKLFEQGMLLLVYHLQSNYLAVGQVMKNQSLFQYIL